MTRDLLIIGGGPAGLAAALAAAAAGGQVTLLDAGATLGGQLWRQPARSASGGLVGDGAVASGGSVDDRAGAPGGSVRDGAGAPAAKAAAGVGGRAGRALRAVAAHPRIEVCTSTTVCRAEPGQSTGASFLLEGPGGARTIAARTVILATGASELSWPFPGWDLPGVVTPGAAQALLKAHGVLIGQRVLVAGTGPFLWPVAAGLHRAGARIVALVDAAPRAATAGRLAGLAGHPGLLGQAAGYLCTLAAGRVPMLSGRAVVAAHGGDTVTSVTVARLDRGGRPRLDTGRAYPVDAVCVGWGFVPATDLAGSLGCPETQHPRRPYAVVSVDADQATSASGVFAAGEVTGIGGGTVSWWEGTIAGAAAARALGLLDDAGFAVATSTARRRLWFARHAAGLLESGFPLLDGWPGWLTPETVVCRCEEVTWQEISAAVDEGSADVRGVKGLTRCGMGWCQGRICGPAVRAALAQRLDRAPAAVGDLGDRPFAAPIRIGALAGDGTRDGHPAR